MWEQRYIREFVDQLCHDILFLINSVDFFFFFSNEFSRALGTKNTLCHSHRLLYWKRPCLKTNFLVLMSKHYQECLLSNLSLSRELTHSTKSNVEKNKCK